MLQMQKATVADSRYNKSMEFMRLHEVMYEKEKLPEDCDSRFHIFFMMKG